MVSLLTQICVTRPQWVKNMLPVIHYRICGPVCFQFTLFLCDDWENIYIYIYIYYQLFRVMSWNNGMRCMSFYILIILVKWFITFSLCMCVCVCVYYHWYVYKQICSRCLNDIAWPVPLLQSARTVQNDRASMLSCLEMVDQTHIVKGYFAATELMIRQLHQCRADVFILSSSDRTSNRLVQRECDKIP